nr:tetratricopeptide repeat protein [candidate division Zixibacteria bacterium]
PLPEKPSIAVLPLTNIGGDPEQEYFADGMTDDLITDLSKISGLFVIARNSVFAYKGKTMKVEQIGRELGVRYLLEGSVRKAGDRVRINTQLIDATTGAHLWAERYDRDYQDIFALQDEVIQRIVSALLVKLTPVEEEQLARTYTDNLEAYEYYLHGLQNFHTYTPEGFAAALLMFEKAIGLDPSFAQAYAVRAWAHYLILTMGYLGKVGQIISVTRPTGFTVVGGFRLQGVDFAKRALSLDDRLPMAHSVMALVHLQSRDYDEAVSSVARSVALDPNNAESYNIQAYVLTRAGRHEEALKAIKTAYRLNPKPPARYALTLSEVHFDLRQYAEAIESGKKALGGMPDWKVRQDTLVPSYAYLGQMEEARAELEKLLKQNPQLSISWLKSRAWLYLYKRPEDWEHFLEGHRRAGVPKYPRDTVD